MSPLQQVSDTVNHGADWRATFLVTHTAGLRDRRSRFDGVGPSFPIVANVFALETPEIFRNEVPDDPRCDGRIDQAEAVAKEELASPVLRDIFQRELELVASCILFLRLVLLGLEEAHERRDDLSVYVVDPTACDGPVVGIRGEQWRRRESIFQELVDGGRVVHRISVDLYYRDETLGANICNRMKIRSRHGYWTGWRFGGLTSKFLLFEIGIYFFILVLYSLLL